MLTWLFVTLPRWRRERRWRRVSVWLSESWLLERKARAAKGESC